MGVDCRIVLPDNVRIETVAKVIGILAGLPARRHQYDPRTWWADVPGVSAENTIAADMAMIKWADRYVYYFFESSTGGRLLLPRSTPFWCALGLRLIEFFGGRIDLNDGDEKDWDRRIKAKTNAENRPHDGEPWYNLQDRLMALRPMHRNEIAAARKFAAYPDGSYAYAFDQGGFLTIPTQEAP